MKDLHYQDLNKQPVELKDSKQPKTKYPPNSRREPKPRSSLFNTDLFSPMAKNNQNTLHLYLSCQL